MASSAAAATTARRRGPTNNIYTGRDINSSLIGPSGRSENKGSSRRTNNHDGSSLFLLMIQQHQSSSVEDKSEGSSLGAGTINLRPLSQREKRKKAKGDLRKKERVDAKKAAKIKIMEREIEASPPICLCDAFPILERHQFINFRRSEPIGEPRRELLIETRDGKKIASILYSKLLLEEIGKYESGKRYLLDAQERPIAVIFHTKNSLGHNKFKICGSRGMHQFHRKSEGLHLHEWAEVQNRRKGLSPRFAMKLHDAMPLAQNISFETTPLQLPNLFSKKPRSISIHRKFQNGGKIYDACAQITWLKDRRSITISSGMDFGLWLCFLAVVDEMIEMRIF